MGWKVIDEFDEGDFNVAMLKNEEDGDYSITIASTTDEVWLSIYDRASAQHIFNHLQTSTRRIWNGGD